MKTFPTMLVLTVSLFPLILVAESPIFSVRIGPKMQSSQIGLQMGAFQPYVGLDYLSMGLDASIKLSNYYSMSDTSQFLVDDKSDMGIEGTVRIWMPHAGVRYYLNTNKTKPYVFANIFKAFPSIDGKITYNETSFDEDGNILYTFSKTDKMDKSTKDTIEDLLGIWGLNLGFGAEYTFNENLSIGGEFGFKLARTSINNKTEEIESSDDYYSQEYDNDSGNFKSVTETDVTAGLTFSYAAICLNFHF